MGRGGVRHPGSFGVRRPDRSVSFAGAVAADPLSELIGGLQAAQQGAGQVRGGAVGNFVGSDRRGPSADYVPAARPPRSRVVENADYEQFLDWMDGKFSVGDRPDGRNPEAGSADAAFFAPAPAPVSLPEAPRMQPGSFNMDPGMRARDEFQNVASAGYNQNAQRVAERGGAKQYETSVQEEQADQQSATARKGMLLALMAMMGVGGVGGVASAARPMTAFQRGTFGQVGANPGLGRSMMGTPSARQAAANRGLHPQYGTSIGRPAVRPAGSANDMSGVMDNALAGTPLGRAMNLGGSLQRGPRLMDTPARQWFRR